MSVYGAIRPLWLALAGLTLTSLLFAQGEAGYNTKDRILRIRELGKRDWRALPALTQYLSDPSPEIRIEAVKAIVRIDTEHSLDPLVEATRDVNEDVQIRAVDGIVNVYVPGYVAKGGLTGTMTRGVRQIKGFFSSRNDQVVDGDVRVRPDVGQALGNVVTRGNSVNSRANAALAAGILRAHGALPDLEQAVHAKDSDLIFESLIALQKIHDPSAGPSVGFLTHDLDDRIQSTALETIGVLRCTACASDVRLTLSSARNVRMRRAALAALAMLGQPQDRSIFQQYTGDRDAELRAAGLEGLGRIREPEDFPVLEHSFDEGEIDWRIHLAAAFGMVNEGKIDTSEFSPLSYLVESLQTKARASQASAYLTELAPHKSVSSALATMLPTMEKSQKISLCAILGDAATPDNIRSLDRLSKDADPDVAFAALKALRTAQTHKPS
jgi:HEAT repeat protein